MSNSTPPDVNQYLTSSATAFEKTYELFQSDTDYWRLGNVFDTILDYLMISGAEAPADLMATALDRYYTTTTNCTACWYDDFCWWGIASTKAFDPAYASLFGDDASTFQTIAINTWGVVYEGDYTTLSASIPASYYTTITQTQLSDRGANHQGALNAWATAQQLYPNAFSTAGPNWAVPRFDGGAWQYDFSPTPTSAPGCSGCTTSNPIDSDNGTQQLSLMNGLVLVFASRMAQAAAAGGAGLAPAATYEAVAASIHDFLNSWMFLSPADQALLNYYDASNSDTVVVRGMVSTFAPYSDPPGTEVYPPVFGYSETQSWAGSAGLILGGLVNFDIVTSTSSDLGLAGQLANGIRGSYLAYTPPAGGGPIVQPYNQSYYTSDPADMASGTGVCWRYVLYAYKANSTIQSQMQGWIESSSTSNVFVGSANNAVLQASQMGTPGYGALVPWSDPSEQSSWTGSVDLFAWFNVLSTLTTCYYILSQSPKA